MRFLIGALLTLSARSTAYQKLMNISLPCRGTLAALNYDSVRLPLPPRLIEASTPRPTLRPTDQASISVLRLAPPRPPRVA